jgi:hypothetical protein
MPQNISKYPEIPPKMPPGEFFKVIAILSQTIKSNYYFLEFFSKPFAFPYRLVNFRGSSKVHLNQIQKYVEMGLLGPNPNF